MAIQLWNIQHSYYEWEKAQNIRDPDFVDSKCSHLFALIETQIYDNMVDKKNQKYRFVTNIGYFSILPN